MAAPCAKPPPDPQQPLPAAKCAEAGCGNAFALLRNRFFKPGKDGIRFGRSGTIRPRANARTTLRGRFRPRLFPKPYSLLAKAYSRITRIIAYCRSIFHLPLKRQVLRQGRAGQNTPRFSGMRPRPAGGERPRLFSSVRPFSFFRLCATIINCIDLRPFLRRNAQRLAAGHNRRCCVPWAVRTGAARQAAAETAPPRFADPQSDPPDRGFGNKVPQGGPPCAYLHDGYGSTRHISEKL